jgi:hypothetical protein
MTNPTPEQLLNRFNSGHLGTAHGIAGVLCLIADKCIDPATWDDPYPCEMIRRETLISLAMELTADLPQPYGRTPEQVDD